MLRLTGRARVPLYYQIKEHILSNIESGTWPPGFRLPNEFDIAHKFRVSRTTVRQAFNELKQDGVVRRRPGQGTFVTAPKLEADIAALQDLMRGLLAPGPESSHRTVSQVVVQATAAVGRTLRIPVRTRVVELVRLRAEHGEPIILEKYYIPASRAPGLENEDLSGQLLYPLLVEHYGITIRRAKTWLEPTVADEYEAQLLEVRVRTPCMLIRRLLEDDKKPVVSTKMLLRGDKCRYVISWEH